MTKLIILFGIILIAWGCDNGSSSDRNLDEELAAIIAARGLTGDPCQGVDIPDIESPLAQLGMKLFFTKALGGDMDVACVTCHHPLLGGGDQLSLSVGVGADDPDMIGPGRTHPGGGPTVPRNTPTTFNIAMWDECMFFDGRIESLGKTPGAGGSDGLGIRTPDSEFGVADESAGNNLPEAQSRFPVTSKEEMRGELFEAGSANDSVRVHLAARIGNYGVGEYELVTNNWLPEFRKAFNSSEEPESLITYDHIAMAISAYERSQAFINNPWKAYVEGDEAAIGRSAKKGAILFFTGVAEGGAGCGGCHQGDFFTDEGFHVIAMPQVGPGKGDGLTLDNDFGRFRESQNPADRFAFRTPSLLNIEVTGPYGHSGAYTTLGGIVRHHLNPRAALDDFDYSQLDPFVQVENTDSNTRAALNQMEANQQAGMPSLETIRLTDADIADIVSFLLTLTDPCVKDRDCLGQWIPDESDNDPDGLRLRAIDHDGRPL